MYKYDPGKDRSEEYGWKKVCDEHQPTEEEQKFWGNVILATVAIMTCVIFFIPGEYI
jgi:hypothetical protein